MNKYPYYFQSVASRSEKIAEEEVKCRAIAENAQQDLDEALPALQEAIKALESLNKKDMTEIKSYSTPPQLVEKVMEAVMILKGNEPTWPEAKRQLSKNHHYILQDVEVCSKLKLKKGSCLTSLELLLLPCFILTALCCFLGKFRLLNVITVRGSSSNRSFES